jgi:uncharacterized membrane protein
MALLILSIILFLGLHSIRLFAPRFRDGMIARLGIHVWRGIYSVLSIATLVMLIYGFGQSRGEGPLLYVPPTFLAHIMLTLMLIATILLVASVLPAGKIVVWIKHPMMTSVKVWAFAHLLVNGGLNHVLLFGSFLAWAVLVRISLKRRLRAGETVRRPFVSVKWDIVAIVIGIIVYGAIVMYLHEALIGVSPLAVMRIS